MKNGAEMQYNPENNLPSNINSEEFQFILEEYKYLRDEINNRLQRISKLVNILLTSSLVYITTIFVPLRIGSIGSIPDGTGDFAKNYFEPNEPIKVVYFALILILPFISFAIEVMCASETDAIRRSGIYIRDNIERKIRRSGYRGWEDWLGRQDKATRRRTSEKMARYSRYFIILLYSITSSIIGSLILSTSLELNSIISFISIISLYCIFGGMIVYFLKKSQENELSPNFYDVVIMDIDGCLTDSGRNISNANLIAIDAVKKLGVTMILATGRSAYGTWHVLEKLNAVGLHVASNGACITSWPDKRNEIISPVESNSIPTVINTLNSNRIPWAAFGEEEVYCDAKDLKNIEKILLDRQDIREGNVKITGIKSLDSWSWSNCGSISKIWCYLDISEAIKSKNLLEMAIPNVQVSRTTNETIEFFAQEASKISAVREILDRYNKFDAKTLVFGDHDNDLKVMAWGDHAVAPFNASVQVKGLGSVDTFSVNNDEDFVAEAMKEYFGIRVDSFNT